MKSISIVDIPYLDAMHKGIARQITINESRTCTNSLNRIPQQHKAVAVATIKSNDLIPLDS